MIKNWKQFNESHEESWEDKYQEWLELRAKSEDEDGEKLCYCGHTKMCDCGDPDIQTFIDACERGDIISGDPDNGWKTGEIDDFDELSEEKKLYCPNCKDILVYHGNIRGWQCIRCGNVYKTA